MPAPNAYIRLWSCLDGFEQDDLDRLVPLSGPGHADARDDPRRLAARLRAPRGGDPAARPGVVAAVNRIPADLDMAPFVERARAFLSGTTRTRAEIDEFLRENDFPRASPWGFAHWLDLVRVPPSGTWAQRRAHTFALAEEWVGRSTPPRRTASSTSSGATSRRSGLLRARTSRPGYT